MSFDNAVVVALDGSASAANALQWAADEAQHTDRPLVVVHVGDAVAAEVSADPRPFGRELLDEAVTTLVHTHPRLLPATALLDGEPAKQLIDISYVAAMLVLGRGRRGLSALLLGSVAHQVLAHAHCPTVVVGAVPPADAARIVVGVADSPGGTAALRFACAEAARRDAEVVAVRSWSQHEWRLAVSAALPLTTPEEWEGQERTVLDECVRPARAEFPDVPIRALLTSAPVEIALEREAAGAAMLVLGCRRADDARLPRLGPIASWAAHHFDCPVVVVGNPG